LVCYDENENVVNFIGSINETFRGWNVNGETFSVHRSWVEGQIEHVNEHQELFETFWNTNGINEEEEVYIIDLPTAVKQKWVSLFEPTHPKFIGEPHEFGVYGISKQQVMDNKWKHQDYALEWFTRKNVGILAMATGTGKTRTAIKILNHYFENDLIDFVIINTSERLLIQWNKEIQKYATWKKTTYWNTSSKKEGFSFLQMKSKGSILYITYSMFQDFIKLMPHEFGQRCFIVVDEIHNIGSEKNREALSKMMKREYFNELEEDQIEQMVSKTFDLEYKKINFRLGLSATPFSLFSKARNQFVVDGFVSEQFEVHDNETLLENLIDSDLIFYYGLENGINDKILSPFDYFPLNYEPTEAELAKRSEEYRKWSALASSGEVSPETPYIMASNVLKNAQSKIPVFAKFLEKNPDILSRCIIFVHSTEFGREVSRTIHRFTNDYREFFSGNNPRILTEFAEGRYETLITCHMISEGVDIQNVSNIVLFASDVQKLETIQRIGRALRFDPTNPSKVAKVIDFIFEEEKDNKEDIPSDILRKEWLLKISGVR
jgi:superfamily II DNA or RNA helicase